ncbi:MAG: GNAT family N-acetyltransferase [Patescibacteria group bacterium]
MIRKATREDIPVMVELAAGYLQHSSYAPLIYDKIKTHDFLEELLDENGFLVVSERNGQIVGGMVGDVITPWFSNDKIGVEYILYMHPDYRTGRDAYRLIRSWVEWCKYQGVKQIRPAISSGINRGERLYQAMGFEAVGSNFLMNVSS